MTSKQQGILGLIVGTIVLVAGIFLLAVGINTRNQTAFDFVIKSGAVPSTVFPGSYEYSGYRFFANNRVVQLSTGLRGTYTKDSIKWDNGTVTAMSTIFK